MHLTKELNFVHKHVFHFGAFLQSSWRHFSGTFFSFYIIEISINRESSEFTQFTQFLHHLRRQLYSHIAKSQLYDEDDDIKRRLRLSKYSWVQYRWLTLGIQATWHAGISETLGESRRFSDSREPSKLQPSSCKPPTLILNLALRTPLSDQLQMNFRLSMEHCSSLLRKMEIPQ